VKESKLDRKRLKENFIQQPSF